MERFGSYRADLRDIICWGERPGWLSRYSDSLRAGRSGDRIPVGGEIFRIRPYSPCGPPSFLYNGYRIFPGGKAAGAWRWPLTPSSAEVEGRVELYICSPSGLSWPVIGWPLPLPSPVCWGFLLKFVGTVYFWLTCDTAWQLVMNTGVRCIYSLLSVYTNCQPIYVGCLRIAPIVSWLAIRCN